MPIFIPFFNSNGLNTQDIFILKAIFSAVIILFEVPSGYLGDVLGRRKALILGTILTFSAMIVYSQSSSFLMFVLAETLLGIGISFVSGADSALMYDTLETLKADKKFVKYEGQSYAIGSFSEAAAGLVGGYLALFSLRLPFYFQIGIAFIGVIAAWSIIEPPRHKKESQGNEWNNTLNAVKFCLSTQPQIRLLIFFSAILGLATYTMAWLAQPYFEEVHIPLKYFGVLWAILNLLVGIGSWYAHRIKDQYAPIPLFTTIIFMMAIGYIGASIMAIPLGVVFIAILYIARGLFVPIIKDFINRYTPSHIRATVLSVRSFLIRIVFIVVGPILGWIATYYSLSPALCFAGIFILTTSFGLLSSLYKLKVV